MNNPPREMALSAEKEVKNLFNLIFLRSPISSIKLKYTLPEVYNVFYKNNCSRTLESSYGSPLVQYILTQELKTLTIKRHGHKRFVLDLIEKDLIPSTTNGGIFCLAINEPNPMSRKVAATANFLRNNVFVCSQDVPGFISQKKLTSLWKEQQVLLGKSISIDFKTIEMLLSNSNATLTKKRQTFRDVGRLTGYANLILKDEYIENYSINDKRLL
jgi:hypothetical protein